jgi:hypothetical protein
VNSTRSSPGHSSGSPGGLPRVNRPGGQARGLDPDGLALVPGLDDEEGSLPDLPPLRFRMSGQRLPGYLRSGPARELGPPAVIRDPAHCQHVSPSGGAGTKAINCRNRANASGRTPRKWTVTSSSLNFEPKQPCTLVQNGELLDQQVVVEELLGSLRVAEPAGGSARRRPARCRGSPRS